MYNCLDLNKKKINIMSFEYNISVFVTVMDFHSPKRGDISFYVILSWGNWDVV